MARKTLDDRLLTVAEVARLTGFGKSTIYAGLCDTHKLKRIQFRSSPKARPTIRFYESDVVAWLRTHIATAEPEIPKPKRTTAADRVVDLLQFKRSRER